MIFDETLTHSIYVLNGKGQSNDCFTLGDNDNNEIENKFDYYCYMIEVIWKIQKVLNMLQVILNCVTK